MRYWREKSRYNSGWQYSVEYFGIIRYFSEIEHIRELRESLKDSRKMFVWYEVKKRVRSLRKRGRFGFTLYNFHDRRTIFYYLPFGGMLCYFWEWSYVHFRYHSQIRSFLDEAYEAFKKGLEKVQ
jgi:hypothetical protein